MLTVEAACEKLRGLGQGAVTLDRQFEPGIALIVIDNASRHNALSGKMMVEFHDIVLDLERSVSNSDDDLVAIIVTGSPGRSFCAGLDLSFARDYLHEATASLAVNKVMNDALERFARLPYITVASVAGPALGGGTELLTAFDFICMASTAFIRFVQTRMGVSSPWGGARRLVNHIGRKQALRLLAGAPKINAVKARDIGLVDVVVQVEPLDNVYQQCLNATTAFLKNYVTDDKNERVAPAAVRAMKQLVIRADRDADLVFEEKLFASVAGSSKI